MSQLRTARMHGNSESLSRWTLQSVPPLGLVALSAAMLVHSRYGISWKEVLEAASIVFVLQSVTVVPMFWAVGYWRKTGDSRPGLLLSGLYALVIVLTVTHYGVRWHMLEDQDVGWYTKAIVAITLLMVAVVSYRRYRAKTTKRG